MANESGRKQDREIRLSETQMRHPGMEHVVRARMDDASTSGTAELADEYDYVVADLRRIAIIAAAMVGVLAGLALFVV